MAEGSIELHKALLVPCDEASLGRRGVFVGEGRGQNQKRQNWAAVEELGINHHGSETRFFTMYP